jgi:hypothetical protein
MEASPVSVEVAATEWRSEVDLEGMVEKLAVAAGIKAAFAEAKWMRGDGGNR